MDTFQVHQLRVSCEVQTPIRLNEHQGSAIRGALYNALRGSADPRARWSGFCANKGAPNCAPCPVSGVCPVMRLVSTLDEQGTYGRDAPRPYVINPPLPADPVEGGAGTCYAPGEHLTFDLLLAGEAAQLLPYVVLALDRLAYEGLGARCPAGDGRWRRGTARIVRIDAVQPLTGESSPVLRPNERVVHVPSLPVGQADVLAAAARLPDKGDLTLHFITPLRLIERGQLVKTPYFRPLLHRLVERVTSLAENFSPATGGGAAGPAGAAGEATVGPRAAKDEIRALRDAADAVALVENHTRWLELRGYSTRLGREQMLGGLAGRATYRAADWAPFLPWLVWGTIIHAGKNAVKGDGWFGIEAGEVRVGLPGWAS